MRLAAPNIETPEPAWGATGVRADRRWLRLIWIVPLLLAAYASWPALQSERMGDDELLIFHNAKAKDLGLFSETLTADYFYSQLPLEIGYYRPLPKVGYLLQFAAFGHDETGYHAVSIVWLLLAVLMAHGLLVQLSLHPAFAALGAAFFGSHFVIGMPVGLITAQSDVMLATFFFASLRGYVRWVETQRAQDGVLALLAFCLALGSKESAVVIWSVVLFWELGRVRLDPRRLAIGRLGLFAMPVVAYVALRVMIDVLPRDASFSGTAAESVISSGVVFFQCSVKALLSVWTPFLSTIRPAARTANVVVWSLPLIAGAALLLLTSWRCRRLQWPTLLLVLPLLPALAPSVSIHTEHTIFASERWALIPALGAGWLFAGLAWSVLRRHWPRPGAIAAYCLLWLVLGVQAHATRAEVASYKTGTDRMIYTAAMNEGRPRTPDVVHDAMLARVLRDRRDRPAALDTWRAQEGFYRTKLQQSAFDYNAHFMLGEALFHQGKLLPALFELSVSYYGVDPRTGQSMPKNDSLARDRAQRAFLLGRVLEQMGDLDRARSYYLETLGIDEAHAEAAQRLAALGR